MKPSSPMNLGFACTLAVMSVMGGIVASKVVALEEMAAREESSKALTSISKDMQ